MYSRMCIHTTSHQIMNTACIFLTMAQNYRLSKRRYVRVKFLYSSRIYARVWIAVKWIQHGCFSCRWLWCVVFSVVSVGVIWQLCCCEAAVCCGQLLSMSCRLLAVSCYVPVVICLLFSCTSCGNGRCLVAFLKLFVESNSCFVYFVVYFALHNLVNIAIDAVTYSAVLHTFNDCFLYK